MQYRNNETGAEVSAHQTSAGRDLPAWFHDAAHTGHIESAGDLAGWIVKTADGESVTANPGDYIVRAEDGTLSVETAAQFEGAHTPVESTQATAPAAA
jgi:hypothetical protein